MTQSNHRIPLQSGIEIVLNKNDSSGMARFRIIETAGFGASCVVYSATDIETENNRVRIKEYYPANLNIGRNPDHSLAVEGNMHFRQGMDRFVNGYHQQIRLRNCDEMTNTTSNVQGVYFGNNTIYTVLTYNYGQSYDMVEDDSLNFIFRIARAAAKSIKNYHANGLLHLDIKPSNIFVMPESVDMIMMFDFDSVISKQDLYDGKCSVLSYSSKWAAPEQLQGKIRQICEQTDLYSIGAMVFERIYHRSADYREQGYGARFSFNSDNLFFQNVNPKLFPLLEAFFKHTLCAYPKKRYHSADELIAQLDELVELSDKGSHYFIPSAITCGSGFWGREAELSHIEATFEKGHVLFLRGEGGIGKSQIALRYGELHTKRYDTVLFVSYETDFVCSFNKEANISINSLYRGTDETDEDFFARKLNVMKKLCDDSVLLIIDNFDTEGDKMLDEIVKLKCDILFTSRIDYSSRFPQLSVDPLPYEVIRDMFCAKGFSIFGENDDALRRLYQLFSGNTLIMSLIMKNLEEYHQSPANLLQSLSLVAEGDNPNIEELFRLYFKTIGLDRVSKVQQMIMFKMAKEPLIGVRADILKELCELDDYTELMPLVRRGFINYSNATGRYTMHSVLRDAVRQFQGDEKHDIKALIADAGNILEKVSPEQITALCGEVYERHNKLDTFPVFVFGTEDFESRINLFKRHFLCLSENEFPIFAVDQTGFSKGKRGFVLTNCGIHSRYSKVVSCKHCFFTYSEIKTLTLISSKYTSQLQMINKNGECDEIAYGSQAAPALDFIEDFFETLIKKFPNLLSHASFQSQNQSTPLKETPYSHYTVKYFVKRHSLTPEQCRQLSAIIEDKISKISNRSIRFYTHSSKQFEKSAKRYKLAPDETPIVVEPFFFVLTNKAIRFGKHILPYQSLASLYTEKSGSKGLALYLVADDGKEFFLTAGNAERVNNRFELFTAFLDAMNKLLSQ